MKPRCQRVLYTDEDFRIWSDLSMRRIGLLTVSNDQDRRDASLMLRMLQDRKRLLVKGLVMSWCWVKGDPGQYWLETRESADLW